MSRRAFVPDGETPRVLITAPDVAADGMALMREAGIAIETMEFYPDADTLVRRIERVDPHGILVRMSDLPVAGIRAAPSLRVIARHGVGLDPIPVDEATARGIPVTVTKGANSRAVAEHALAVMLSLTKGLGTLDARMKSGHWDKATHRSVDLEGACLLVIGHGAVGSRVSAMAAMLGVRVLVYDPYVDAFPDHVERIQSLDDGLRHADIISLHCPLSGETRDMIDRAALNRCKPGVFIVNTARGGIVNEDALFDALTSGQAAGAGLDCFDTEPPAGRRILSAPNTILTPHTASTTTGAFRAMGFQAARSLVDILVQAAPDRCDIVNPGWVSGTASQRDVNVG